MHREIIFRGKRLDNGQWVYGYYLTKNNNHFILSEDDLKGGLKWNEVDPKTVGQIIVKEDGNDIYEGDVIQEWKHGRLIRQFFALDIRTFIKEYYGAEHGSTWKVICTIHDQKAEDNCNSAPEAICKAALLAVLEAEK